jgi:hypothetical protein
MFSNEIEPIVNTTEKGGLKEGDVMMKRLNEAVLNERQSTNQLRR